MFNLDSAAMNFAQGCFSALDTEWHDDPPGMYRLGYMLGENRVISFFRDCAAQLGMTTHFDAAGNAFFVMAGKHPERGAILSGSHVDSVRHGGRYDGPAGVVAPFTVAYALHAQNITPDQDFVIGIFRNEESPAFGQVSLGAKLALGEIDPEKFLHVKHTETGKTFEDHLKDFNLGPRRLKMIFNREGKLIPVNSIAAMIEMHIEQGPALHEANMPVGIVNSIRGNVRWPKIEFSGVTGHSGTVPFSARRDASIAANRFISNLYDKASRLNEDNRDCVFSVSFETGGDIAKPTNISDRAIRRMEYRSTDTKVIRSVCAHVESVARSLRKCHGVEINLGNLVYAAPASLDEKVVELLRQSAARQAIPALLMPSGAGHDAAVFANAGVPTAMIFIRQETGISHHHAEDMGVEPGKEFAPEGDYAQAIRVLGDFVLKGYQAPVPTESFVREFDMMNRVVRSPSQL